MGNLWLVKFNGLILQPIGITNHNFHHGKQRIQMAMNSTVLKIVVGPKLSSIMYMIAAYM